MTRSRLILAAGAGSFLLLGGAFVFQALGYAPCKMCLWQRWPHAAAIVIAAVALVTGWRVLAWLGALAAAITCGIGVYHSGVEFGWWEGPSSCTGAGPGLGGLSGDSLLSMDAAPALVMCDEVVWSLAGLSMAGWNALLSYGLVVIWIMAARRPA